MIFLVFHSSVCLFFYFIYCNLSTAAARSFPAVSLSSDIYSFTPLFFVFHAPSVTFTFSLPFFCLISAYFTCVSSFVFLSPPSPPLTLRNHQSSSIFPAKLSLLRTFPQLSSSFLFPFSFHQPLMAANVGSPKNTSQPFHPFRNWAATNVVKTTSAQWELIACLCFHLTWRAFMILLSQPAFSKRSIINFVHGTTHVITFILFHAV